MNTEYSFDCWKVFFQLIYRNVLRSFDIGNEIPEISTGKPLAFLRVSEFLWKF